MKTDILKKLIKEAVREAIQEEIKDILLEAVRAPKTVVNETVNPQVFTKSNGTSNINPDIKRNLRAMIGGEFDTTLIANSSHAKPAYTPPPVNTTGEGSSLPSGEVSLDQIMGLMTTK